MMKRCLSAKKNFSLALAVIFASLFLVSFVSANVEMKVFETTIHADDSNYAIPSPTGAYIPKADFGKSLDLPEGNSGVALVNGYELPEGEYIVKIESGAVSRWDKDNVDTSDYIGEDGGKDLVWESVADVVYSGNSGQELIKFGEAYFDSEKDAEDAGVGKSISFYHEGGKVYFFMEDWPIDDNRGSVTLGIYKSVENQEIDLYVDSGKHTPEKPYVKEEVTYYFTAHNTGEIPAINLHYQILLDEKIIEDSHFTFFPGDYEYFRKFDDLEAGLHEVKIILDPENAFAETNEDNNVYVYSFRVYEKCGSRCDRSGDDDDNEFNGIRLVGYDEESEISKKKTFIGTTGEIIELESVNLNGEDSVNRTWMFLLWILIVGSVLLLIFIVAILSMR